MIDPGSTFATNCLCLASLSNNTGSPALTAVVKRNTTYVATALAVWPSQNQSC